MLRRVTAKLREQIARRRKHERVLKRSRAREQDLLDALKSARNHRARVAERREKGRREDWAPDRMERLADEFEAAQSVVDRLLEKLDARQRKSQRVLEALEHDRDRVQHLRERRRRIITDNQDRVGRYWHMAEFDCNNGVRCPDYMRDDLDDLAERVLDKLRARYGQGHVNSGYRTASYNAQVGGEPNSYHIYDVRKSQPAADCTFANGSPSQWAAYARQLGVGGVGQYATFVHVDTGPRRDWWG